ncbi:hypothetical protein NKJ72_05170 [Mesorhizobium sp. M0045]|uniref:hypothetical protein n=1 Tax=Mesorhizobium sp. M0045 TaxID=2956857 RepID=UPI003339F0AE
MMIIGKKHADYVSAGGIRAMAETGLDKVTAKVAVHAVVRLAGDVAGVSVGIDLHMHVAALADFLTLTRREQPEVAPDDDAYRLLRSIAQFDN